MVRRIGVKVWHGVVLVVGMCIEEDTFKSYSTGDRRECNYDLGMNVLYTMVFSTTR